MKRFGYWRDPLMLATVALYACNTLILKPRVHGGFWHSHFNDLLLIPGALPWVLWVQRWLGWRTHDRSPTWSEISLHGFVWAIMGEVIAPRFMAHATADWRDVLAYGTGAALAGGFWQWQETRSRVTAAR